MSNLTNEGKFRIAPAALAVVVTLLMIISAVPAVSACDPVGDGTTCDITLVFVDQKGPLADWKQSPETGDERVYVDGIGWKQDGDVLTVNTGSTIYYRAHYVQGSGLKGPKESFVASECGELMIEFRTVAMEFYDQFGQLQEPPATGNEQVYMDSVGWMGDGEKVVVPLGGTLYHRAHYAEGSGLKGPKLSDEVKDKTKSVDIMYRTLTVDLVNPCGSSLEAPPLTGNERIYIDSVGWKGDGDLVVVPEDSTVYHRAHFAQGSGLKGPKVSLQAESGVNVLEAKYGVVPIRFVDQNGDLEGTGNERIYVDSVGWKADDDEIVVPLDSTVYYRAHYAEGSGLKGPKLSILVDETLCSPVAPAPAPVGGECVLKETLTIITATGPKDTRTPNTHTGPRTRILRATTPPGNPRGYTVMTRSRPFTDWTFS